MTLKEIGDGVKESIEESIPLVIDGALVIKEYKGKLYFELGFLRKYGNIIRVILRDEIWEGEK